MRQAVFLLVASALLHKPVSAQQITESAAPSLEIGFHAGATASIYYGDYQTRKQNVSEYLLKPGFAAGAVLSLTGKSGFGFQADINFERKGNIAQYHDFNSAENLEQDYYVETRTDYFTLPVCLRYSVGNTVKFYAELGAYGGYLSALRYRNYSFNGGPEFFEKGNPDYRQRFDVGNTFGFGALIPVKKNIRFGVGVRNNYGLMRLEKGPTVNNEHKRNESFGILMSLRFSPAN